jgi:SpoVK/Ycf46/Vps4 family AAA+-type ATPase
MHGMGIESTLRNYGITGNPMVDSLILAQIIPIVFAYWQTMSTLFKNLMVKLVKFSISWINHKFMSQDTNADIVFYSEIPKRNTLLYQFLMDNVIANESVKSDKQSTKFMDVISKFMEDKKTGTGNATYNASAYMDDFFYAPSWHDTNYKKWSSEYDLHIVNGIKTGNKMTYVKTWKHHNLNEDVCKTFVDGKLIIKIALIGKDTESSKIEISIYQLKDEKNSKFQLAMFEKFLEDRFNFSDHIPIVQTVRISSNAISQRINEFVQANWVTGSSGSRSNTAKMSCGNMEYIGVQKKQQSIQDDEPQPSCFTHIRVTTKSNTELIFDDSIKNYDNKLNYDIKQTEEISTNETFNSLYTKYVSNDLNGFSGEFYYGFFYHNNRTILIYYINGVYHITFISYKEPTTLEDVKDIINGIMSNTLSNRKIIPKVTERKKRAIKIFKRIDGDWHTYDLDIRSFDTIYLPSRVMAEITYEFEKFSEMKQLYKMYQIPYRKGILFYGPPGTGKTSLVKALAYEHQMNIYLVNVNDSDINDDTISNILSSIGKTGSKILLFEDIDSAFSGKEMIRNEAKSSIKQEDDNLPMTPPPKLDSNIEIVGDKKDENNQNVENKPENKVLQKPKMLDITTSIPKQGNKYLTYSGLLNALDGVLSGHEGVITVMTTNYVEKLGQAFLRPGRIDRKFKLSYCNDEQFYKMIDTFIKQRLLLMQDAITRNNGANTFGTEFMENNKKYIDLDYRDDKIRTFIKSLMECDEKYTPAQMQQYLIRNIENIDSIFDNVKSIQESFDCVMDDE